MRPTQPCRTRRAGATLTSVTVAWWVPTLHWASSVPVVQTGCSRDRSWQVTWDDGDLALHFLLWLRDASGVAVPGMGDSVPPTLLTSPEPIPLAIDADGWLAWWRALLKWQLAPPGDWWGWWQCCPPALAEIVEPVRERGLMWVQDNVKFTTARTRRRYGQELGDHVQPAITQLQRELGSRLDALDVAIHGLAVTGEWLRVEPSGSPVLMSWSRRDDPQAWLIDALRPAASAAATW